MADIYVGEIRLFAFNYAPQFWLACEGQTVSISQYQMLYALIGVTYGGDGVQNFKLPDLRGRFLISAGTGTGLTNRALGVAGGQPLVALTSNNVALHNHALATGSSPVSTVTAKVKCSSGAATNMTPSGGTSAKGTQLRFTGTTPNTTMRDGLIALSGQTDPSGSGGAPHDNMPPFLTMKYCTCYNGLYPSQS